MSMGAVMGTDRILGGRYLVGEVIGAGATSVVHRGRDLLGGRIVAIKVLRSDLAQHPTWPARFRREALAVAGVRHPGVVVVHDTGFEEVEAGSAGRIRVPFIVMEHVTGGSLRDILRKSRPTLGEALHLMLGILAALEASHRAGVVHRDIKPGNVMVTPDGEVKVVDFGVACGGDPDATITRAGELVGTPSYLSPEQVRGEGADVRSDLYSAGCLLYELLTGRPPFVGDDPVSVAYRHVHEVPAPVHTALPALEAVVVKVLAKAPEDRFQNARSFRRALLAAALGIDHHHPLAAPGAVSDARLASVQC